MTSTAGLAGELQRRARRKRLSPPGKLAAEPGLLLRKGLAWWLRRSGRTLERRVRTFWGEPMTVVLPDNPSLQLWRYGYLEEELTGFLLERLRPGAAVVDVGAHLGYFALLSAHLVGPEGTVVALEPTPRTFTVLERNVAHRDIVRPVRAAAWSEDGGLDLLDFGWAHAAYNTAFEPRLPPERRRALEPERHRVRALRLDDLLDELEVAPAFVKIDAESAEEEILRGMARTLQQARPVVALEVGEQGVEGAPTVGSLTDRLEGHGYAVRALVGGGLAEPGDVAESDLATLIGLPPGDEAA